MIDTFDLGLPESVFTETAAQEIQLMRTQGGRSDPVIGVQFARRARELLEGGGLDVEYEETDGAHHIDPTVVPPAVSWLAATL